MTSSASRPSASDADEGRGASSIRLRADALTLAYDAYVVSRNLNLDLAAGERTAIVGPNACGKSTLLRALARLHRPTEGVVLLDGADIAGMATKRVARRVGLLSQSARVPDGMTVRDLVSRGRFPHQGLLSQWSGADEAATVRAMELTGVAELAHRDVDALSGGQRQRVWLAMVLAQETPTILLDEPTTYLDLAHQVEMLQLCRRLNEEQDRTIVAVLHDLNQAARCATRLVVMHEGRVRAVGAPQDVLTADLVGEVFGLDVVVVPDPVAGTPMVVPLHLGPVP